VNPIYAAQASRPRQPHLRRAGVTPTSTPSTPRVRHAHVNAVFGTSYGRLTLLCRGPGVISGMTIHAPLEKTVAPPDERATAPFEAAAADAIRDSFPLLDHRTRSQAIPRRLAPFGHYLAFSDDGAEWLVPIEPRVTHIGRGLTADVRIEEQRVSRTHAILVRHGHRTRLLDNRSANGTFVNGRPIFATNITDGDVIRIGPVVARYLQVA